MFEIRQIEYGSEAYMDFVLLRYKMLRAPLGLEFKEADLKPEKNEVLLGGYVKEKIISTLILRIVDGDTIKLRQMCVDSDYQNGGFGTAMLKKAEEICKQYSYSSIELHARANAVNFYSKYAYRIVGDEFMEVGIPHFKMTKRLMQF